MREMEEAAHCVKIEFGYQVPLTFTTHFSACEQAQSTLSLFAWKHIFTNSSTHKHRIHDEDRPTPPICPY